MREPAVHIVASGRKGTLHWCDVGPLAAGLTRKAMGLRPGFARRHGCKPLVWFERYELTTDAIAREKQVEGGSRAKKLALIEAGNPQSRDLYVELNV